MSEKSISYLDRTYAEFKNDIIDKTRKYYSDIFDNYNDASIGMWFIDVVADIADTLSYNIDRVYQETGLESATTRESLLKLAKNNGVKVPGKKCAIVEVELSCTIPVNNSNTTVDDGNNQALPDYSYAPIMKRGSLFTNGFSTFELYEDVDFSKQFDKNGISNRKLIPVRNYNGIITGYQIKKLSIAVAGQSKIYKKYVTQNDIEPFMTVELTDDDVTNVESIILKQGSVSNTSISDFFVDRESFEGSNGLPVLRYFEVDNLAEKYRFGYVDEEYDDPNTRSVMYNPVWDIVDAIEIDGHVEPIRIACRGKWKRLKNKYTTEFTESGSLKITFGSGVRNVYGQIPDDATEFTKYMMARMEANDYMGVLPEPNTTMFILYHVGGGEQTNIAKETLNDIVYASIDISGNCADSLDARKKAAVKASLSVTNTTPSYGGKDEPSDEELKVLIKYNSAAQNRCVTVKDYFAMISRIEPKYGIPFRYNVVEENNKIVVYSLGIDYQGHLTDELCERVSENVKEYLSNYKMVNDFVEIMPGRVINVSFSIDLFIDKSYDKSEVVKRVIDLVYDYMDVRRYNMGDDIFLGDLEKEISKQDGVINLIALRCYNNIGDGYSSTMTTQDIYTAYDDTCNPSVKNPDYVGDRNEFNLAKSDKTLFGDASAMFEIKYKEKDIVVNVKTR